MRVIKQFGQDEGANFPLAAPILAKDIYVDDLLFGAEDRRLVLKMKEQIDTLLKKGSFQLRKWASNCPQLLNNIDPSDNGLAVTLPFAEHAELKTLGLRWSPYEDVFRFKISPEDLEFDSYNSRSTSLTKRNILSHFARLYNPLG